MTSYCRRFLNFGAHERPTVGDQKMSYTNWDHLGWMKCDGRRLNKPEFRMLFDVIGYTFGGSGDQFYLPDFRGRVPGMAGQGEERDDSGYSRLLTNRNRGDYVGEEIHQLTIPELASHNHGVATDISGGQVAENNRTTSDTHNHDDNTTGYGYTGTAGDHNHGITDPGHFHSYVNQSGDQSVTNVGGETAADQEDYAQNTGTKTTGITINNNGDHEHTINSYTHHHTINSAGNDVPHNTMQPTLFAGNMFIYCGKTQYGTFPYTVGKDVL
jgi:microcystin-dependent protein